jgi:hypothetical protein
MVCVIVDDHSTSTQEIKLLERENDENRSSPDYDEKEARPGDSSMTEERIKEEGGQFSCSAEQLFPIIYPRAFQSTRSRRSNVATEGVEGATVRKEH